MKEKITEYLKEGVKLRESFIGKEEEIIEAVEMVVSTLESGNTVLLCGNGGSAADSQHIAAEFVNKFYYDRKPLPAIALTTDTSILTSAANDYSFEQVFEKQVEAVGEPEDLLIGISTSGNSENVIRALKKANKKKIKSIGLTGKGGGKMKELVDLLIEVPSTDTPKIQEMHITIGHLICLLVEEEIFDEQ